MITLKQLENLELEKPIKIGMYDVIRMIRENWSKVSGEIIINAWIKSGLLSGEWKKEMEELTTQMVMDEELENQYFGIDNIPYFGKKEALKL